MLNDLRYAFRMLLKSPGFTAVAVLTLALGIGATTAIVSIVHTAVIDPLRGGHTDRLLQLGSLHGRWGWSAGVDGQVLRELRQRPDLFARVVAHYWDVLTLEAEDYPVPVRGAWVTADFFSLWNVQPMLGRTFAADEGLAGKNDVFVISHRLWQRQFGGDASVIGRTVRFRERSMTVVGVMPAHFSYPDSESEYWRPLDYSDAAMDEHGPNLGGIVEMQAGVTVRQVQALLDVLTSRHQQERRGPEFAYQARDLREMFSTPELRRTLGLLLGAVLFVLLIAAANVASLQLARMQVRGPELAIRSALGAGRARMFRQLLTENLLLACVGGAAGLAVSAGGIDLLQTLLPENLPRLKPIAVNVQVLGIAAGITLLTGLLFGLAPALRGRRADLNNVLKRGSATTTGGRADSKLSQALLVAQLALVLALLSGAGLMLRSVFGLLSVNPGLDPRHVVRVYPSTSELERRHYSPDPTKNKAPEAVLAFFSDARQRIAAIPGVRSVGVAFEGRDCDVSIVSGATPIVWKKYWIGIEEDDPLRVLRVPLRMGRWLSRADVGAGVRGVVINESAAWQLWPGQDPVGKRFAAREKDLSWPELTYEVAGVVGDTRDYSKNVEPQPTFYRAAQWDRGVDIAPMFLVIRGDVEPATLYKPIGQALKAAGADLQMPEFINLHEALWRRMAGHRAVMQYLTLFAGVGLFLAAIGIYGVLSYSVARRTREIGIRMALGARLGDIRRLILRRGLALLIVGGVIGIGLALMIGRMLRAYLFGVGSADPLTLVIAVLILVLVALVSCLVPARRAARVDPMVALRSE